MVEADKKQKLQHSKIREACLQLQQQLEDLDTKVPAKKAKPKKPASPQIKHTELFEFLKKQIKVLSK